MAASPPRAVPHRALPTCRPHFFSCAWCKRKSFYQLLLYLFAKRVRLILEFVIAPEPNLSGDFPVGFRITCNTEIKTNKQTGAHGRITCDFVFTTGIRYCAFNPLRERLYSKLAFAIVS
jgi:hypothetical protein